MKPLTAGTPAPDFTLPSTPDQKVALSELRGKPVVLVFYPADWSPVCSDQLGLYNELRPEFAEYDAQIVGISVGAIWRSAKTGNCTRPCWPTLSRKAPSPGCTGCTMKRAAKPKGPCS